MDPFCKSPINWSICHVDVSKNNGTPKSSILIGFSMIFTIHFGVPLFLETPTVDVSGTRMYQHLVAMATIAGLVDLIQCWGLGWVHSGKLTAFLGPKMMGLGKGNGDPLKNGNCWYQFVRFLGCNTYETRWYLKIFWECLSHVLLKWSQKDMHRAFRFHHFTGQNLKVLDPTLGKFVAKETRDPMSRGNPHEIAGVPY